MLLYNIPVNNIHDQNSLSNKNFYKMKYNADIIVTNYPFGYSIDIDLNDYNDKDYWGL